jgi:hypothetical protein
MKHLLLSILGCCALLASAQQVTVVKHQRLLQGVEGPAYYPVLDQSGTRLLFASGVDYGLKLYDMNDDVVTRISSERCAGIDAGFGNDGDVYFIGQTMNENNLIYRTGYRYNVKKAATSVVLEAQHGAVNREMGTRGVAIRGPHKSYVSSRNLGTAVDVKGSNLIITVNGKEHTCSPVASYAGYLWPSLSPDGTKVLFYAAGAGAFVTDLNGKVLASLGNYEMPCWYDNDYVVAQNATDDGHQFTSSQIMLLKADGTFCHELTRPTSMSMQPTSAAGKIVYTSIDGNLYLMEISIND